MTLVRHFASITLALSAIGHTAAAQHLDQASALEVQRNFAGDLDQLHKKFTALAAAFPADEYAWRPAPNVRSVGEVFMYVATELYYYAPLAYGAQPSFAAGRGEPDFPKFERGATKASVASHLNASYEYARKTVMGVPAPELAKTHPWFGSQLTIVGTSMGMSDDMHEHLGQLIAYARMNGIVPPWSK